MVGRPVVHGIHLVLWALDRWAATGVGVPGRLTAAFAKPAFPDEVLTLAAAPGGDGGDRFDVRAGSLPLATVTLAAAPGAPGPVPGPHPRRPPPSGAPVEREVAALTGASGRLAVEGDAALLAELAPRAAAAVGVPLLAALGTLSRLVGMECPGLHSLFSSLELAVDPSVPLPGELAWRVARADPRVGAVDLEVGGGGLTGRVRAFVRPAPAPQPSWEEVAPLVRPGELAGQRALVVGGSRGLGEVTARVVAAAGGHPVVTYASGAADAEAVANDVRAHGAPCGTVRLDVRRPAPALRELARRGWTPTHVYYYATPRIFVRKGDVFEPRLFREFSAYYVDGFVETVRACRAVTDGPLHVLYPSTVAVDEPVRALTEYTAAKVAGEEAARLLDRFAPRTVVEVVRLPRVVTDQTATLLAAPAAGAATTVLGAVRALAARSVAGLQTDPRDADD